MVITVSIRTNSHYPSVGVYLQLGQTGVSHQGIAAVAGTGGDRDLGAPSETTDGIEDGFVAKYCVRIGLPNLTESKPLMTELFHERRLNRMHYTQAGLFAEEWSWQ